MRSVNRDPTEGRLYNSLFSIQETDTVEFQTKAQDVT